MSSTATYAIRLTLDGAGAAMRAVTGLYSAISGGARGLMAANQQLFYFGSNIAGLFRGAANVGRQGAGLVQALVGPNEDYERAKLQFEQLLGSAEAADERIRELYAYGNKTPFLNPDVLKAGRLLQQFGGDALGAGDSLEMVGDMAAFAQTEMADVAFWVARAYSAMQAGRPWGESAMRLMEMGLLTDDTRAKLEALAEGGAKPADVWAGFVAGMARASGSAGRLGESMYGVKSTLSGMWDEIKRLTGQGLFDALKDDFTGLRDSVQAAFDDGRVEKWSGLASKALKELYAEIKDKSVFGLSADQWMDAAQKGQLIDTLSVAIRTSASNFGTFLLESVREKGPDFLSAMVGDNKRLRGLLGIDRQEALRDMAEGRGSFEAAGKKLGIGDQFSMLRHIGRGSWADNGNGDVTVGLWRAFTGADGLDARIQDWARGQRGAAGHRPGSMVSIQDAIGGGDALADLVQTVGGPGFTFDRSALRTQSGFSSVMGEAGAAFGRDYGSVGAGAQAQMLDNVNARIEEMNEKLGESVRLQADLARSTVDAITRLRGTF